MSIAEMKWKITSSLDKLSDDRLRELLTEIEMSEKVKDPQIDWDITKNMDRLIHENLGLLKRLS